MILDPPLFRAAHCDDSNEPVESPSIDRLEQISPPIPGLHNAPERLPVIPNAHTHGRPIPVKKEVVVRVLVGAYIWPSLKFQQEDRGLYHTICGRLKFSDPNGGYTQSIGQFKFKVDVIGQITGWKFAPGVPGVSGSLECPIKLSVVIVVGACVAFHNA